MSALSIQPTYPIFTDIDGQPLENGYVWIGTANLDPQTNPISVFWDAALTIPATQPIRTLGGYPSRSGTPARLYVNSDYSIRVQNRNGSNVYSALTATERYSNAVISSVDSSIVTYTPGGTGAVETTVQNKLRLTINVMDFIPVNLHAAIFNFTSTANVDTYIQAAIDYAYGLQGGVIWFPAGKFNVANTINWNSYIDARGVFGEDNTFGVQDPLNGTWIKWTGANTTSPIFRVFNTRMFRLDGFHLDGDNKNVKGIQLDSDNTPSGSQNEFHRFNIRRCLVGFEWGTGGLATPYANDGTRVTTFTIWSQMSGSIGFRINSGNAGQMSTIESGGVQVDNIGIDLICANLLQIRRVFCGGQVRNSFIRAQLPIDVLVEGSSSENWGDRTDGRISSTAPFLLVIPSVEQPAFALRDFTMTLMNNQCNNPIVVQSPIRIVDIGSNFGYCYNPSNVAIASTATVESGGNGTMVSVINSGTQTWTAGFPYPSGWQTNQYVRLTNLKPESTSLFWGVETSVFPLEVSGNDRGLSTVLRNASGGYANYFTVNNVNVGAVLCDASSSRYYTTATVFVGTGAGSPEGSISAPVGSLWTRTDGGASTTLYVKQSGTGNTGWVAK
jgi:hypothetical protein